MKCKLCGEETEKIFNIAFQTMLICQNCANTVTMQNILDLLKRSDEFFAWHKKNEARKKKAAEKKAKKLQEKANVEPNTDRT